VTHARFPSKRYSSRPKGPVFTDKQEQLLSMAEEHHNRAHIIELGVSALLSREMPCGAELKMAHAMLGESITYRQQAYDMQGIVKRQQESPRNARTAPKRKTKGRRAK